MVMKQNASPDYTEETHMLSVLHSAENATLSIIKETSGNSEYEGRELDLSDLPQGLAAEADV